MSEIFRIEKRSDFTIVRNGLLRDKTMSLKAKGLLITMLSKPDGWDYTLNGLQTILLEGRDAIASGLTELERHGYLVRRKTRDRFGRFTDVEYIIYEYPVTSEPDSAEPTTAYPEPENPETDEPLSENPTELNKDINKKRNNQETTQASIDSIHSAAPPKRIEDEGIWREIITENLESDCVREQSVVDAGIIDDIVELMVETVCSTREYIRVGKEDRPAAVVKSRLLKLDRKHLEYVLWCFRRNTTEVRNIRAYLLTTLYNSYFSANSGTMAQVQHDLYGTPRGGDAT